MATKILHSAQKGVGKGALDAPLAVLAALAVGFVIFAMPVDILGRLVEISRLPNYISALQPPLGMKARLAFSLAGAGGTFLFTYLLLKRLGQPAKPRFKKEAPAPELDEEEGEMPKLRRADVHPDAPARRPILAGRDFGEPEIPDARTAPFWKPEPFAPPPAADEIEAEEVAFEAAPEEPLELGAAGFEMVEPEPAPPPPAPEPVRQPEPVAAAPVQPTPAPAPAYESESIVELMARLERGLAQQRARRAAEPMPVQQAPVRAYAPSSAPQQIFGQDGDDRLRSAIENLQRIAQRAG